MAYETTILGSIVAFLAFLSFISLLAPPQYQVMQPLDLGILAADFIGIGGTCAIATGIPCAAAMVVLGLITFLNYFVISFEWFKALIIAPIAFIIMYLVLRLGRGVG